MAGTSIRGVSTNQLNAPLALALDSSNALYIADHNNSRVQKWASNSWTASTVAGQASGISSSTAGFLNKAGGLAVDSSDNVYVVDIVNCRVQFWQTGATVGTTVAGNVRQC